MDADSSQSRLYPGRTHDLVVVLPGIMGSELYDTVRGRTLWGASLPLLLRSWVDGAPLRDLALDEREIDGTYGRVRAVGLLKMPEVLPFLRGAEPYTALVKASASVLWTNARCWSSRTTGGCPSSTTPPCSPTPYWPHWSGGAALPSTRPPAVGIRPGGRPVW